ncbi:MAG TPA: non-homologous end-joining DNA ligase [Candidatus Binatia bacterium]|jgi:bifunctional non-homologous end joining protein LigD
MPRAKITHSRLPAAEVGFIEPMYALAVKNLPEGKDWLYEVKFDGYRCLAGRRKHGVTLWSRRGNLFTAQFPHIARACERLPADTLVDGEIVAVDESGRISFNLLQHHRSKAQALLFYVFDVLIHRGKSLLNVSLEERRKALDEIFENLGRKPAPISQSETIDATPAELVRVAKEFGFEGILAKRRDSYYESGKRSGAWLKYRVNRGQELVIGGYVPGNPIDSIIVGYCQDGTLLYAAKVRNGFVPRTRRAVAAKLKGLEIGTCPFANLPERKRTQWALTKEEMKNCRWVKPELVAQIEFAEWTPDGHLRHATFVGLREDKDPREVVREAER